jgi:hypothetical protein
VLRKEAGRHRRDRLAPHARSVDVSSTGRTPGKHRRLPDPDLTSRLRPLLSAPTVRFGVAACVTCALGFAVAVESQNASRSPDDSPTVRTALAGRADAAGQEAASRASARAHAQPQTTPTKPAKPATTKAPAAAKSQAPKPSPTTAKPKASPTAKPSPKPKRPVVAGLTREQMDNAATIVRVGQDLDMPRRGLLVAMITAMQESDLYNIASGVLPESTEYPYQGIGFDHDSVGLFQQRTSTGWGTVAELMTPSISARKFYAALAQIDGWENLELTVAAQSVQVSAFPDAYAKHEERANTIVDALT